MGGSKGNDFVKCDVLPADGQVEFCKEYTVMTVEIQTKKGLNRGVEFLILSGMVPRVEPLTVKNSDFENSRCHKTPIFSPKNIARR